jgi:hypothetical protein
MSQQTYDRGYYQRNRAKKIAQARAYYLNYASLGLRKPRPKKSPEERKEHRRQQQHERYLRKREAILAQQKAYRDTHKAEIKARRRQRNFERVYGKKEL